MVLPPHFCEDEYSVPSAGARITLDDVETLSYPV
jgi:hypothetical protein